MHLTPRTTSRAAPAERRMGPLPALVAMTRPSQVALIILVLANGALLGLWRTAAAPQLAPLLGALVLTIGAAVAVHLANEAADHRTDRRSERTAFSGGSGALWASGLSPRVPLRLARWLAVVVGLSTAGSVALGLLPPAAALLMLAGLGGGLAYSLRPLSAMRRGWGEPLNALLGALVLPLFGVALVAGSIGTLDVIAFVPFLLVALASVMATAWVDREADAATGKATMQVRLAPGRLRRIHATATCGFVAATVVSAALDAMPLALLGLAVLPALILGTSAYTRTRTPVASVAAMVGLALITTATLGWQLAARPG